jgi:hypothetical protein
MSFCFALVLLVSFRFSVFSLRAFSSRQRGDLLQHRSETPEKRFLDGAFFPCVADLSQKTHGRPSSSELFRSVEGIPLYYSLFVHHCFSSPSVWARRVRVTVHHARTQHTWRVLYVVCLCVCVFSFAIMYVYVFVCACLCVSVFPVAIIL